MNAAIKVEKVSKRFLLPHEKNQSLKSAFTRLVRRFERGYEIQHALKDISFEVKQGEFFGIVGRNGSGKSTLLKMLAGIYQPTSGHIKTQGRIVPFIELGVGFNGELTGRENVYLNGALLGFSKREIDALYEEIVSFAELEKFMDQKLKNYSSGMQVRLAFSLATRANADILIVDEVLAVGDAAFQRKCFEYFKSLKANKKTVVFVTHSMDSVREYCDRAMLIDASEIKAIGKPQEIARKYTQLFMDQETVKTSTGERWGDRRVRYDKVTAQLDGNEILVTATLKAHEAIDILVSGLHVAAQDGVEIVALNNRIIQQDDITHLQKGDTHELTWRMLNVFNDGNYFITVTLVDDTMSVLDWWVKAAKFSVKRPERAPTSVLPPTTVAYKALQQ